MKKYTAPSLARGIQVLRFLENKEPVNLEQIARQLVMPKSSCLRILDTLAALGTITRDPVANGYKALVSLTSLSSLPGFDQQVRGALSSLAQATGFTAEWYIPNTNGMLLVSREEPEEGEVKVQAKVGFLRTYTGELETVACLGNAWREAGVNLKAKYWVYNSQGKKTVLTARAVKELVGYAGKAGIRADQYYNSNGVRRTAAIVLNSNKPAGCLALAENYRPGTVKINLKNTNLLVNAAIKLSRNSQFTYIKI